MLTRSSSVRTTRSSSSVLGKRPHHPDPPTRRTRNKTKPPPTPDPTPKRPRVSIPTIVEGDWNKENIAPFANAFIARDDSPTTTPSRTRLRTSYPNPPTYQLTNDHIQATPSPQPPPPKSPYLPLLRLLHQPSNPSPPAHAPSSAPLVTPPSQVATPKGVSSSSSCVGLRTRCISLGPRARVRRPWLTPSCPPSPPMN